MSIEEVAEKFHCDKWQIRELSTQYIEDIDEETDSPIPGTYHVVSTVFLVDILGDKRILLYIPELNQIIEGDKP